MSHEEPGSVGSDQAVVPGDGSTTARGPERVLSAAGLVARGLAAGAAAAAILRPEQVVTADWVRWKCLYGCPQAGSCVTCPPHSPTPEQTRSLLAGYETILFLRFDVQPGAAEWTRPAAWVLERVLELERELFLAGHYKAFAVVGGRSCDRDEVCGTPGTCTSRERLRPGPAGCGIDIFATSAAADWPLRVVPEEGEPYHRYALLLVE